MTNLSRVAGFFVLAIAALLGTACTSPSTVNPPDMRASSDQQWGHEPGELFPSYSYKRVGGG